MMNLDNYQWSPTFLAFNSNPDETARSTSWYLYDVCIYQIHQLTYYGLGHELTKTALLPQLLHTHPPHNIKLQLRTSLLRRWC